MRGPQLACPWPPAVPPGVEYVLRRAMAREPGERYPSAHDFVRALRGLTVKRQQPAPTEREREAPPRQQTGKGATPSALVPPTLQPKVEPMHPDMQVAAVLPKARLVVHNTAKEWDASQMTSGLKVALDKTAIDPIKIKPSALPLVNSTRDATPKTTAFWQALALICVGWATSGYLRVTFSYTPVAILAELIIGLSLGLALRLVLLKFSAGQIVVMILSSLCMEILKWFWQGDYLSVERLGVIALIAFLWGVIIARSLPTFNWGSVFMSIFGWLTGSISSIMIARFIVSGLYTMGFNTSLLESFLEMINGCIGGGLLLLLIRSALRENAQHTTQN
jgi:hypothetical protein